MDKPSRQPYTIEIFLPQGTPNGLKVISRSLGNGRCLAFPWTTLPDIKKKKEYGCTGVYVLVEPSVNAGSDIPHIYIGEANKIGERLEQHAATDVYDWAWCVFFVSTDGSLDKAIAKRIEHKLFKLATHADRAVLHQEVPQDVNLSEPDAADADGFMSEMLDIFPLVGLTAFQAAPAGLAAEEYLTLCGRGISARGFESDQGFVVVEGSHAALNEADALPSYHRRLRSQLQDQGLLIPDGESLKLTKNYVFNSSSQAASVFLAAVAGGPVSWKDKDGTTLKELRESAAKAEGD
jgi:hypothetical protein